MHYVSLREFSYIYILKKVLKFIEGGGQGEVEVGRWPKIYFGKGSEREKGTFFGYSQVSDFIPPSVRVCRPNARTAALELKELEVGRINQIGCGAPSVR